MWSLTIVLHINLVQCTQPFPKRESHIFLSYGKRWMGFNNFLIHLDSLSYAFLQRIKTTFLEKQRCSTPQIFCFMQVRPPTLSIQNTLILKSDNLRKVCLRIRADRNLYFYFVTGNKGAKLW